MRRCVASFVAEDSKQGFLVESIHHRGGHNDAGPDETVAEGKWCFVGDEYRG
jgi:hypothetical protein